MTTKGMKLSTDQEIKEMINPTQDLVREAIEAGDEGKTKQLVERIKNEYDPRNDGSLFWAHSLLTYIFNNNGLPGQRRPRVISENDEEGSFRMQPGRKS